MGRRGGHTVPQTTKIAITRQIRIQKINSTREIRYQGGAKPLGWVPSPETARKPYKTENGSIWTQNPRCLEKSWISAGGCLQEQSRCFLNHFHTPRRQEQKKMRLLARQGQFTILAVEMSDLDLARNEDEAQPCKRAESEAKLSLLQT